MKKSLAEINDDVCKLVRPIKLLSSISWPSKVEVEFFNHFRKGHRPLLNFQYDKLDFSNEKKELQSLLTQLSESEPTHIFTSQTIKSYINGIDMIHSVGTSRFQELSIFEYGVPSHKLFGSEYSHLETAKKILKTYHEFDHPYMEDLSEEYDAKKLKKYLKKETLDFFGEDAPKIVITDKITSKASAGRTKVSIRENALFSEYDLEQLLIHEVMTHSLTAINGCLQKGLSLLGQGAPRTTKTQEGLATFSEVITGNMDLIRLKRISLRVIALDMALNGADFYDLFQFFIDNEQDEKESFLSASRILRGGDAKGGIVYTKDGVYLEGLIRVHSFFRWAFKTRNLDLAHLLFCGRLDINDVFLLKDDFESGVIGHPKYLPKWYQRLDLFAGKMAFSMVLNGINLENVEKHYSSKLIKVAA